MHSRDASLSFWVLVVARKTARSAWHVVHHDLDTVRNKSSLVEEAIINFESRAQVEHA